MRRRITYGDETCQSFTGRPVEALVQQQIFRVLEPAGLALCASAAEDLRQEWALMDRQWRHRLERARYEVDRAARQYHAVEPESRHELRRPVSRWDQLPEWPQLVRRLEQLADGQRTAREIAEQLSAEGYRPPKRRTTFNAPVVQALLSQHGLCRKRPPDRAAGQWDPDEWWLTDLARTLAIPSPTLHQWRRRGWVHARQLNGPQGRWIVWADREDRQRLSKLRSSARGWYNQPQSQELTRPRPHPTSGTSS